MKLYSLIIFAFCASLLCGCGSETEKTKPDAKKEIISDNSDEAEIQAMITNYFDRVKEGDKTVLYENEFSYYTDEKSLDEYMELSKVLDYKYDTLGGVFVDSIRIMKDSAWVWVKVVYNSADGSTKERPYRLKAYRNRGRWIRPYLSHWDDEFDYLEQIRIYDSVTAAEEGH
jgi:hypothetical protein